MELFTFIARTAFIALGFLFLVISIFGFLRTIPKYTTGSYTYITESTRLKRSFMSGLSVIIFVSGGLMVISGVLSDKIDINSALDILFAVLIFSPFAILAGIQTYKRLWTFTKTRDDVVFLDENKEKK